MSAATRAELHDGTRVKDASPDELGQSLVRGVSSVLGDKLTFTRANGFDLNQLTGRPHSTTSLPYAIHGSATVVSQKVGTWLASFRDPIRAILGTGIHTDQRVIIKRKYVVGVAAQITPERAPARTVSIQEDVREVELDRYGGDIEMNLNQFLVPGAAQEELTMKIDAQKLELERKLCELGWHMLLAQGTKLSDAIMRSNPVYDTSMKDANTPMICDIASRVVRQDVFGAMNKYSYPVINLLAACRYASAYSVGTQRGSVLVLPHGITDILRYSRREEMHYKISGVKSGDKHKPLTMQLDDVYADNATGVKIIVKHPNPRYDNGAAHPNVYNEGDAGLVRTTHVATFHSYPQWAGGDNDIAKTAKAVNLQNGGLENLDPTWQPVLLNRYTPLAADIEPDHIELCRGLFVRPSNGGVQAKHSGGVLRLHKVVTSSAVLAAPGSGTGELLIGYPFTSVSTSQADERMRIQLRCYLGSVLYQPDNVIVLDDVYIEGVPKSCSVIAGDGFAPIQTDWVGAFSALIDRDITPTSAIVKQRLCVDTSVVDATLDDDMFGSQCETLFGTVSAGSNPVKDIHMRSVMLDTTNGETLSVNQDIPRYRVSANLRVEQLNFGPLNYLRTYAYYLSVCTRTHMVALIERHFQAVGQEVGDAYTGAAAGPNAINPNFKAAFVRIIQDSAEMVAHIDSLLAAYCRTCSELPPAEDMCMDPNILLGCGRGAKAGTTYHKNQHGDVYQRVCGNKGEFGKLDDPTLYVGLHGPPSHFDDSYRQRPTDQTAPDYVQHSHVTTEANRFVGRFVKWLYFDKMNEATTFHTAIEAMTAIDYIPLD